MPINILFFGATAHVVGKNRIEMRHSTGTTSQMVFDQVKDKFPALCSHKLLYSVNQSYPAGDDIVRDGDEIAIFTAVSGG